MKILLIYDFAHRRTLGASRVWMDFGSSLQRLGHSVDQFSADDVFGTQPLNAIQRELKMPLIRRHLHRHLQRVSTDYDIIDCHVGLVTHPNRMVGRHTLFVTRSVGSMFAYRDAMSRLPRDYPPTLLEPARVMIRRLNQHAAHLQVRHSDLVNVPNTDEVALLGSLPACPPIVQFPYGLIEEELASAPPPKQAPTGKGPRVAFLGMWCNRKGKLDMPRLWEVIRQRHPGAILDLLGTAVEPDRILQAFPAEAHASLNIVPSFKPEALPGLLQNADAAVFPSYAEGFGIAVIEMLHASLPVFAYRLGGPADILAPLPYPALVERGDTEALAGHLADYLALPRESAEVQRIRAACREHARSHVWLSIAEATMKAYESHLEHKRHTS